MIEAEKTKLAIENGALINVPIYCSHKRGKNWLAVITENPTAPAGLERSFQEKAGGKYYYMVSGINSGDVVEFGADYYSGSNRKVPHRAYGVVADITDEYLELVITDTPREAFLLTKELAIKEEEDPKNPFEDYVDELLIDELLRRGYKIEYGN